MFRKYLGNCILKVHHQWSGDCKKKGALGGAQINTDDEFNYNEVKNYFFTENANKPLNNDNEKSIFKFVII